MKTLHVNVDQIALNGARHDSLCACPVARAVNRKLATPAIYPLIENASIRKQEGHCTLVEKEELGLKRTLFKFKLPEVCKSFLADWDARKEVGPISFDLELSKGAPAHGAGSL